jgi:hypothetical protein
MPHRQQCRKLSIKFKDPFGGVAVVFLEEPLRLTLRERVCLLGKVALESNPVARAFCCVLYLMSQPCGWTQTLLPTHSRLPRPNDFTEYSNCYRLMQAPESSF